MTKFNRPDGLPENWSFVWQHSPDTPEFELVIFRRDGEKIVRNKRNVHYQEADDPEFVATLLRELAESAINYDSYFGDK